MMDLQKKNRLHERILLLMTFGCIMAYLGTFAVLNLLGFTKFCDPDMYGDTLVSKLMWEQKTLFPQGWFFGNQLYVIATPVLAALFYGITGNTNTAMILATEVMTLLILVSFFYLMRSFTKDWLTQLVGCLLLLASVIAPHGPKESFNVQLFFLQASYYSCYTITLFVVFGDYVRSFQSRKLRIPVWILALALSFATGMQSLRQTVIAVLPILAYELFLALRKLLAKTHWSKEDLNHLIRAGSYAAANLAGVWFIKLLHVPQKTIFGETARIYPKYWGVRLSYAWTAFKDLTAMTFPNQAEFSPYFGVFCAFCLILAAAALILWLIRIRHQENALEMSWLLCLVGMVGVVLSSVLLNVVIRPIYMFTWFPLVALSGIILLKRLPPLLKKAAVVVVCVLCLGNLYFSYIPYVEVALWSAPSDGEQMCQWAMGEGYEYVYGDWYSAPDVAAHSGGKLDAGVWVTPNYYQALDFTNATDIYGEEENKKAIYVFYTKDEADSLAAAQERGVTLVKVADFGDLHAYTSPVPLVIPPKDPRTVN